MKTSATVFGIIISSVLVLCGILGMFGAFGEKTSDTSSLSYLYDTGYATFGADF